MAKNYRRNGQFGQDFYQTYARIAGSPGLAQIFGGPFRRSAQENKQKTPREDLFFSAKVELHETLVIVPSENWYFSATVPPFGPGVIFHVIF